VVATALLLLRLRLGNAGKELIVERVVEAGAKRILLVNQPLRNVARVQPRVAVGLGGPGTTGGAHQWSRLLAWA